jgi:RNA polymerase sigma-70 factor (ECF subfamily)
LLDGEFAETLAAARRGDERAWIRIYDDLAGTVLGYLVAQRSPYPDDVAAEVFLQLVRDLPGFEGSEPRFRSWVFTIVHHRLIDARRRVQARPCDPMRVEDIDRALPAVECESEALLALSTVQIDRFFGPLTADQRAVLLLRVVVGLTLPEVADVLSKRHEAVRALQKRALARVRAAVADPAYPEVTRAALT